MSGYQASAYSASGYGYYGYGYGYDYGPPSFLDASGGLNGPGTSAYEVSDSPAGYVRTSFAYEGYYGNYYQHDTISGGGSYRTNTGYQYYAGAVFHANDTQTTLSYAGSNSYYGYSGYNYHGKFEYSYNTLTNHQQTYGSYSSFQISGVDVNVYASGGFTTSIDNISFSDYNGVGVPGSSYQLLQQSYTNPYGYTTTTAYHHS